LPGAGVIGEWVSVKKKGSLIALALLDTKEKEKKSTAGKLRGQGNKQTVAWPVS
jgi:hypothetical protein